MKRLFYLATFLVFGSVCTYGQTTHDEKVQQVLDKSRQKEIYRAELEVAMHGFRMGGEYSYRAFGTVGVMGAQKHGIHFLAGYRFTKHWYVGGIVGIDITTPFTITRDGFSDKKRNYSIERKDKIYAPIMADVRFYFKPNRVSTYLFTNLGVEFSKSTAAIGLIGFGLDVHTIKSQCVNIGLGVGLGSWESAGDVTSGSLSADSAYKMYDGFVFNFKLGYSF